MGDLTKHNGIAYYCYRCFDRFSRENLLQKHTENCHPHAAQTVKMPSENDNILKFSSIHLLHHVAYTIYADIENLLIPIAQITPSSKTSYIEKTTCHFPGGYAYVVIGLNGRCMKKP